MYKRISIGEGKNITNFANRCKPIRYKIIERFGFDLFLEMKIRDIILDIVGKSI